MATHFHSPARFRAQYFLCILLLTARCSSPSEELGQREAKIGNGSNPSNASSDAVVTIFKALDGKDPSCTGTRLGGGKILTAAHCLDQMHAETNVLGSYGDLTITAIAMDSNRILSVVAGTYFNIADKKQRGFLASINGPDIKFEEVDTPSAIPSGIEAIALVGEEVVAVGWQGDVGARQATLFRAQSEDIGSDAVSVPILLGAGTAKKLVHYRVGSPKLAIALETHDVGRSGALVKEVNLETNAVNEIIPLLKGVFVSGMLHRPDGSIVIGGMEYNPSARALLVTADPIAGEWLTSHRYLSNSGAQTMIDLVAIDNDVVTLVEGSPGNGVVVSRWNLSDESALVLSHHLSVSPDVLREHYLLNSSSPYGKWDSSGGFRAVSMAVSGVSADARIYLSGVTNIRGKSHGMIVGLTGTLSVNRSFSVRGVHLTDETVYKFGPIAVDEEILVPGAEYSAMGNSLLSLTELQVNPPFIQVRYVDNAPLVRWEFASNVDLALATPQALVPGYVGSLGTILNGEALDCIGSGGEEGLRQGLFVPNLSTVGNSYVSLESSESHIIGGDSGGPCFDSSGLHAGVVVSRDTSFSFKDASPKMTVVSGFEVQTFLAEQE